jgi:alpha-galactosidase
MRQVFSLGDISYVKWDMNRIFSDWYSPYLAPEAQGSFLHRYVLGLYRVLETLIKEFPAILFEACASGGNRFDLGMLCYMPQIWASDNTDAVSRLDIQEGYSYGYPPSVIGSHVSGAPNHQTLRRTPAEIRYQVACFGLLGYECNLLDFSAERQKAIKMEIEHYRKWRAVYQFGTFYRVPHARAKGWMVVSDDRKRAVLSVFQILVQPNQPDLRIYGRGLEAVEE